MTCSGSWRPKWRPARPPSNTPASQENRTCRLSTNPPARSNSWLWEEESLYSREEVTLTAAQGDLAPGTVMARATATGNFVPYDDDLNGTVPGAGIAAGVLCYAAPNNAGTQRVVIIARQAKVKASALVWEASNDTTERNAGIAELVALGILVR